MFAALIPILGPILTEAFSRLIPDPQARDRAIADFYAKLQSSDLAQLEVNKAEAGNDNLFVAGWRPAIGWICASALGWQFVVKGWVFSVIAPFNDKVATIILNSPGLDNNVWELILGMLGMGALRSFDKLKAK